MKWYFYIVAEWCSPVDSSSNRIIAFIALGAVRLSDAICWPVSWLAINMIGGFRAALRQRKNSLASEGVHYTLSHMLCLAVVLVQWHWWWGIRDSPNKLASSLLISTLASGEPSNFLVSSLTSSVLFFYWQ